MRWRALVLLLWTGCAAAPSPPASAPEAVVASAPVVVAEPPPPSLGRSREPTPAERRSIEQLMRETEAIRQLSFIKPVEVRIQDRAAMRAYVSRALVQEELARTRRRYVALGLLDPALDVRDLLESLMEEELVGYYDPKARLLAVREDVAVSLGREPRQVDLEWRATVVHELVHALQDQHLGLGEAMEHVRTTDADDAFGALVEGDATLAMLGYAAGQVGVPLEAIARRPGPLLESLNATPERLTGALRDAPAIVREPLLFRYRAGALFSAALMRRGGWDAVNAAHRNAPRDTLTVLEPERYRVREAAAPPLSVPEPSWFQSLPYRPVDDDVLGSFELEVALEHAGPLARVISRAWRGDRYLVLEHAEGDALAWCLRFMNAAVARKAADALNTMQDTTGRGRRVYREGAHVLVLGGLDVGAAELVSARFQAWAKSQPERAPPRTVSSAL